MGATFNHTGAFFNFFLRRSMFYTSPVKPVMLLLAIFCWNILAFGQTEPDKKNVNPRFQHSLSDSFPTIETVAERFSNLYGIHNYFIEFEKRPEGYFVAMLDPSTYPTVTKREIFWSVADLDWKALSLDTGLKDPGYGQKLIRNKFYFDRIPFYGYRGWYLDVIEALEGKTALSDVLQFSLATAWYERTTSLLSDQYGIADSLETFVLPQTKNALSPKQLEVYLQYMGKSLEHYETLVRQAPDYETVVGPATVKLADQYMTEFLQLQYFQNEETALKVLDRAPLTFNDFLLESSRNLLRCCPPNAILFTWGDNDTYPLLYVQAKQGFRRDVVVANLSLLATGRYVNHLRDRIFDAAPLQYQKPAEYYTSDSSMVVYVERAGPSVSTADFFACLDAKNGARQLGYSVCNVGSTFFFTDRSGKILPSAIETPRKGYKVEIPLASNFYLVRDQVAVLDLLCSNIPERPICFASTCSGDALEPYKKHLRLEGLVYRFDPEPIEVTNYNIFGTIDVNRSYQFFSSELEYNSRGKISFDGDPNWTVLKNYILFTARELNKQGKKSKTETMLDRYFKAFPNSRMPYTRTDLYMAQAYDEAGKSEKAIKIVSQVLDNFEAGIIEPDGWEAYAIPIIRTLAKRAKARDILDRLDKL
jgi:hypothetical protein